MKFFDKLRYGLRIPQILEKVTENNKILKELQWAAVFNSTIVGSNWFLNQGISPGRAAVGYPLIYVMYRILNEVKPINILEFGLGQSTKILLQYGKWNNQANITTVEHSYEWIELFLKTNNLPKNHSIKQHDNEEIELFGHPTLSVKDLKYTTEDLKYDLIIVDSPYGSNNFSRPQILQLIEANLNHYNFCIVIDDYNRKGEKETCMEIEKKMKNEKINFNKGIYIGEKEIAIYCSKNLWYLTTL